MKYRTIVADPPWPMADLRRRPWITKDGEQVRISVSPYSKQSIEWLEALPVYEWADTEAHLFLWVPNDLNRDGIGVRVVRAWGFVIVSEIVWEKPNFGLGKFPRPCHEHLLIARRGSLPFTGPPNVRSVQRWRQTKVSNSGGKLHSAKPEASYDLVEQVSPGPYLELFARRHRLGWDVWGNESANTASLGSALT